MVAQYKIPTDNHKEINSKMSIVLFLKQAEQK